MIEKSQNKFITSKKTAILVDLSFFIKMYQKNQGKFPPKVLAKRLRDYLFKTLDIYQDTIYRFYIYDCEPISDGRILYPISRNELIFSDTEQYQFRKNLLDALKQQPLFVIRLGKISGKKDWRLKLDSQKALLKKQKNIEDLTDNDFVLDIKQKGVDMKIGLDIASLSIKKHIEKIILITGDSDFVPAIKMARREGIIIQLDPLRSKTISPDLLEHIDLLQSILPDNESK